MIVYDTEIQNSRSERQSPRFVSGVCTLPSLYSFALCAFSILFYLSFSQVWNWDWLVDDFFFFWFLDLGFGVCQYFQWENRWKPMNKDTRPLDLWQVQMGSRASRPKSWPSGSPLPLPPDAGCHFLCILFIIHGLRAVWWGKSSEKPWQKMV